jgi:GT2 family glycosyltransferase
VRSSVIVVNWNAGPALLDCLASIGGGGRDVLETIVVDNDSTDGSLAPVRERHPTARIVETGANLGFAAGANRGAAVARGDVLVFLNPDARVEAGAIDALAGALAAMPGAGIAGGGLVDPSGRWQPGAARFHPVSHLLLDTTPGRLVARGRRAPRVVDWVYGTFMAVRRDAFPQLGGFDEGYFLYGEDLDLCHRAAAHGLRTVHVPDARAVHGANVSAAQRFGLGREAAVVRGEMRFYARRGGPGQLGLFRLVGACKFGLKAALAAALGRWQTAAACARDTRACLAGSGAE